MRKKHIIRICCFCHYHLIRAIFLQCQLIFIIIGSTIGIFLIFTKNVYITLCRTSIRCSGISCIAGTHIIRDLDLRKPIYRQLAAYGHMGREDLGVSWEKTDRVDALKAALQ